MISASETKQTTQPRGENGQPNWYRLYFLLAAFDVLTVCISLSVNHRLMGMYESSVETNNVWADRLAAFAHLNALAAQANAPGNDVFESGDANEASARLDAKLASFSSALVDARQELRHNLAVDLASSLLLYLDRAEAAMRAHVAEARRIFAHIRSKDMKSAGENMVAMDHAFYDVTEALASLSREVQDLQHEELQSQASVAVSMRRIEYLIAALIVVMVSLAALYGHKLAKRAKVTEWQLRDLARDAQDNAARADRHNQELTQALADITVHKSVQDALKESKTQADVANRAKSEFLANMSHEIRTPMTAILGFADVLLEAGDLEKAPPERVEAAKTIKRNGEYLLGIINDILDLSKIEAGKMTIECRDCQPCRIVAEVASLMRVRADAKGLPFNIEYIGAIPETIRTDPTRLRQILINLIGNAIKFTEVGAVRLVTRFVDDGDEPQLQFDVIDTGHGMTDEQVAGLFQPFTQADTSTTRKFGGTGLGLTISKRFAELLGGDVSVVETVKEAGTTFRITVATGPLAGVKLLEDPISATVVADAGGTVERVGRSDLQGCRILLAEDGPDNQRLIAFVLKKAGADVTVKENGKLALDAALAARDEGQPFDVILMDMQMPVMDGYEATGLLRQKSYTGPIIALTAHAMASDREKCIKAGCDDYTTKPIDRKKLIEMIRQHVVPAEANHA